MSISNREVMDLNGKSVAVIGAGRSGLSRLVGPRIEQRDEVGADLFCADDLLQRADFFRPLHAVDGVPEPAHVLALLSKGRDFQFPIDEKRFALKKAVILL